MSDTSNKYSLDLSSARKFFSDALKLAHEYGKKEKEEDKLTVSEDNSNLFTLAFEEFSGVRFDNLFLEENDVLDKDVCENEHKIIIIISGKITIKIDKDEIVLPDDRKFCYLLNGDTYVIKADENSYFSVLSIPT